MNEGFVIKYVTRKGNVYALSEKQGDKFFENKQSWKPKLVGLAYVFQANRGYQIKDGPELIKVGDGIYRPVIVQYTSKLKREWEQAEGKEYKNVIKTFKSNINFNHCNNWVL